jgi:hypothetical protein
MSVEEERKEMPMPEQISCRADFFLSCVRMCEFKKCCKKYKHGKRCKSCPKKDKHSS